MSPHAGMAAPESMVPDLVVVLGMHRSGTSVIARSLQVLGIDLGTHLLPPVENVNPRGFWEDVDVFRFNEMLLADLGTSWHSVRPLTEPEIRDLCGSERLGQAKDLLARKLKGARRPFGLKDPRLARLIPFWKQVFVALELRVAYVISVRDPLQVARSLQKRDGFPIEKGVLLWLDHLMSALAETASAPRVLVHYEDLLAAPVPQLAQMADTLKLGIEPLQLSRFVEEFLDPALCHTGTAQDDPAAAGPVLPLAMQLHAVMREAEPDSAGCAHLARSIECLVHDTQLLRSVLPYVEQLQQRADAHAALQVQLAKQEAHCHSIGEAMSALEERLLSERADAVLACQTQQRAHEQAMAACQAQLQVLEARLQSSTAQLRDLLSSRSWALTAPLRGLFRLVSTLPRRRSN